MDTDKTINITGQHNRYFIRKANHMKLPETLAHVDKHIYDPKLSSLSFQLDLVTMIYESRENPEYTAETTYIRNNISSKVRSYLQQDKNNKRIHLSGPLECKDVYELLLESLGKCYYCKSEILVYYQKYRDKAQWTMERKDNNVGHCRSNCVVSCLGCNLQRRNQNIEKFKQSKNIVVFRRDLDNTPFEPL